MTASTAVPATPTVVRPPRRLGDSVFSGLALAGGLLILIALAAVAVFLILQSLPAFGVKATDLNNGYASFWAYVVPLVFGTLWAALLALLFAVPFSIGIALFISHYAPRRLARALGSIIDLLAAIPSVVYGAWGIFVFAPFVQPFYSFLSTTFPWFPLFQGPVSPTGRTILTVAPGARGDDHPDRHRAVARDLPADAAPERGGGARTGRDPLGDDPDRRAPVRPGRHRVRLDARPRPRARRDARRRDGPLPERRRSRCSC